MCTCIRVCDFGQVTWGQSDLGACISYSFISTLLHLYCSCAELALHLFRACAACVPHLLFSCAVHVCAAHALHIQLKPPLARPACVPACRCMPPEVELEGRATPASDVFALGVVSPREGAHVWGLAVYTRAAGVG